MKNKLIGHICIVAMSAVLLSGCGQKEEVKKPEAESSLVESGAPVKEPVKDNKESSKSAYTLKEPEIQKENEEAKKDITDTDMSASDKTRLNKLIEEIGKETDN